MKYCNPFQIICREKAAFDALHCDNRATQIPFGTLRARFLVPLLRDLRDSVDSKDSKILRSIA